jgi:hypothetical protein
LFLDAVIRVITLRTLARDELRAWAGARSQLVALLHLVKRGDALTTRIDGVIRRVA